MYAPANLPRFKRQRMPYHMHNDISCQLLKDRDHVNYLRNRRVSILPPGTCHAIAVARSEAGWTGKWNYPKSIRLFILDSDWPSVLVRRRPDVDDVQDGSDGEVQ